MYPIMVSLEDAIGSMAAERKIFHSEGDLQYTLAKRIEECTPDSVVRLEYPSRLLSDGGGGSGAIDIWWENRKTAIELKYKTIPLKEKDDSYKLRRHFSHNGRYGFVKDIHKLEKIVCKTTAESGYALLITNDELLWSDCTSGVSKNFSLHKSISGERTWENDTRKCIKLKGTYSFTWKRYSTYKGNCFRYLLVKVILRNFSPS